MDAVAICFGFVGCVGFGFGFGFSFESPVGTGEHG